MTDDNLVGVYEWCCIILYCLQIKGEFALPHATIFEKPNGQLMTLDDINNKETILTDIRFDEN